MLKESNLIIGKSYVNDQMWLVREITDVNRGTVSYRTFHLSTGALSDGVHKTNRREFTRWADREASPQEMASLEGREIAETYESAAPTSESVADLSLQQFQHANRIRMINR